MNRMSSDESLRFRKIPHQSDLFLDYVDLVPKALQFYGAPPAFDRIQHLARAILPSIPFDRKELARILRKQNHRYGCTSQTEESIRTLEEPDTVAVVTGQQVGLFLGPLYTTYKTLTAIRLASIARDCGIRAVPVFWMDSEDHDLAEVTRGLLLEADRTPRSIDYRSTLFDGEPKEEFASAVGGIRFPKAIRRIVDELADNLGAAPWQHEVRTALHSAYAPGSSFANAFGSLMMRLFGHHGLVLFDSQDPEAKPLVSEVFHRAIQHADALHDALVRRNAELEEHGYHAQVHVLENSTILFLIEESERRSLTRSGRGFLVKKSSRNFSTSELLSLAKSSPDHFSPNVLLRPLIQDSLFPTAAYVAGPAEIAYFAQIHALYPLFERPMPVIWPRASFTLLEPDIHEHLARHGLELADCFQGKHHLVEKLIAATSQSSATSLIQSLQEEVAGSLDEVRADLVEVDASLGPALDLVRRKMLHQVEVLETRFVHLEAKRNRAIVLEADLLLNQCYPNKNLQERELFLHHLWARHGPSLLDRLYALTQTDSFDHKIVKLNNMGRNGA